METVRVVCQIKKGFIYFLLFKKKNHGCCVFWARVFLARGTCDQLEVEKLVLLTE